MRKNSTYVSTPHWSEERLKQLLEESKTKKMSCTPILTNYTFNTKNNTTLQRLVIN